METVTWAVHSVLKSAICSKITLSDYHNRKHLPDGFIMFHKSEKLLRNGITDGSYVDFPTSTHWAALPRHTDEVDTWRHTAYFRAGGHSVHTHASHAGGGVCKPAAALRVLLFSVHTTWEGKFCELPTNPFVFVTNSGLCTSTPRAAWSRISHLMHAGKVGTVRRCTLHLTCLPH